MSKGMPTTLAEDIAKKLRDATKQIELWGVLYDSQQPDGEDEYLDD